MCLRDRKRVCVTYKAQDSIPSVETTSRGMCILKSRKCNICLKFEFLQSLSACLAQKAGFGQVLELSLLARGMGESMGNRRHLGI